MRSRILKLLVLSGTLSSACASLSHAQPSDCSSSLILSDRVGIVHVGMPLDSVRRRCRVVRDTSELNEGEAQRVVYAIVAGDTLRIEVVQDAVWRLSVRRPRFATRDSIRAGMPLSRFLIGRHVTIGVGEGKVYVFDSRHPGNSFGLSDEAYARAPRLTAAGLGRLPRSTIIDVILVTGNPVADVPAVTPHYNPKALIDSLGLILPRDGHGVPWVRSMFLVAFRPGTDQPARQAFVSAVDGRVVGGFHIDDDGEYYVRINATTREAMESTLRVLRSMPQVDFAFPMMVDTMSQAARPPLRR